MCDYSLQHLASRPAAVGDKLISTKFHNSITRGFSAINEPNVAVCLMPGTEVAFENEVEYDATVPFLRSRRQPQKVARFRQVNLEYPAAHHDALEFPDGKVILVNALTEGQRLTVLQLPAMVRLEAELEGHHARRQTATETSAQPTDPALTR